MRGSAHAWDAQARLRLVLHHGIVSGAIPGGTRLIQSVIADELAVSTRQVHDALFDLAAEGFVRIDARGGAVARELCRDDLEDIYQIRVLLEPVAAARGARLASADTILRATALLAAMESETDAQRWADFDAGFHRVIGEPGNSTRLAALLENLRELSAGYVRHSVLAAPDRALQSGAEHEEIMRTVLKGDSDAAAHATFRHLNSTLSALRVRQVRRQERSLAG